MRINDSIILEGVSATDGGEYGDGYGRGKYGKGKYGKESKYGWGKKGWGKDKAFSLYLRSLGERCVGFFRGSSVVSLKK